MPMKEKMFKTSVLLNITESQKEKVVMLAKQENKTMSQWLRDAIDYYTTLKSKKQSRKQNK